MIRSALRRFWAWVGDYDFILPGEMTWPSTESFTSGIRLDGEFGGRETNFLENTDRRIHGVHPATACAGEHCTIHNRSDHHMRGWPQNWRGDRGIMERLCPHGVGHPDPDETNQDTVHCCDGCCAVTRATVCPQCGCSGAHFCTGYPSSSDPYWKSYST